MKRREGVGVVRDNELKLEEVKALRTLAHKSSYEQAPASSSNALGARQAQQL